MWAVVYTLAMLLSFVQSIFLHARIDFIYSSNPAVPNLQATAQDQSVAC